MDILRLRSITAIDTPAANLLADKASLQDEETEDASARGSGEDGEDGGKKTKRKKINKTKKRKKPKSLAKEKGDGGEASSSSSSSGQEEEEEEGEGEGEESILEGREGWGQLSARNVLDAVDKAKDVSLGRCVKRRQHCCCCCCCCCCCYCCCCCCRRCCCLHIQTHPGLSVQCLHLCRCAVRRHLLSGCVSLLWGLCY